MCADAKTRGVPVAPTPDHLLLPLVPCSLLQDYYQHIGEISGKIKQDLKSLGCWHAHPRVGQGVKGSAAAPGRGIEVSNWNNLRRSWHRWNPDVAPMPEGTVVRWREMVKTHELTFTDDKSILWDPDSWCWDATPTWYISGVSHQKTRKAGLLPTTYYYYYYYYYYHYYYFLLLLLRLRLLLLPILLRLLPTSTYYLAPST